MSARDRLVCDDLTTSNEQILMSKDLFQAIKPQIIALYAGLIGANVLVWGWALVAFRDQPLLLGSAALAYVLGLRHAVDPDHIAAIDNVTRKLMQEGRRPVTVGLWFALGHSAIVILAAALIALSAASFQETIARYKDVTDVLGTSASAMFLLFIGFYNILVLRGVWRAYTEARRHGAEAVDIDKLLEQRGFLARFLAPLFGLISTSWHMFPLGLLFALGFDTATEISIFGLSAVEASKGVPIWTIMIFPALFTVGMALVDATDGVLMVGAYGWAFIDPMRKLTYNLVITAVSVVVAVFIGGVEALALIGDKLELGGWFWDAIARVNGNMGNLGFAVVALFLTAWLASMALLRRAPVEE